MTLGTTLSAITVEGNGVTTTFTYPFLIPAASDAVITYTDANSNATVLTPSQYFITGAGNETGGTITYPLSGGTPIGAGTSLTIARILPLIQPVSVSNQGPTFDAIEGGLDNLEMQIQQVNDLASRAITINPADIALPIPLPIAAVRANKILAFDSAGQPTVLDAINQSSNTVTATGGITAASLAQRFGHILNVIDDFGATGNGVTDDTAAIAAALATGYNIYFPAGTYLTTSAVTISGVGQQMIGAGRGNTTININSATASGIVIANGEQSFAIRGITVTRSGSPVAGAYGINALASCSQSTISDVLTQRHYIGIGLGPTDYSLCENSFSQQNVSHGVYLVNSATNGALQWQLNNVSSQENGGWGFQAQAATGVDSITMGTWTALASFSNTLGGASFLGLSGANINDVRILGGFFGQDGNDEIYLDTYGSFNTIRDVFTELPGTGPTGPTLTTAASNIGGGIVTTASVVDISISGARINGCSNAGISISSAVNNISGCTVTNNGLSPPTGGEIGITIQGSGRANINGCTIGNTNGNTTQQYGISSTIDGNNLLIVGCDLSGNVAGPVELGSTNPEFATLIGNLPNTLLNVLPAGGLVLGNPAGGNEGAGTINVATNVYKNGTAYTNP